VSEYFLNGTSATNVLCKGSVGDNYFNKSITDSLYHFNSPIIISNRTINICQDTLVPSQTFTSNNRFISNNTH